MTVWIRRNVRRIPLPGSLPGPTPPLELPALRAAAALALGAAAVGPAAGPAGAAIPALLAAGIAVAGRWPRSTWALLVALALMGATRAALHTPTAAGTSPGAPAGRIMPWGRPRLDARHMGFRWIAGPPLLAAPGAVDSGDILRGLPGMRRKRRAAAAVPALSAAGAAPWVPRADELIRVRSATASPLGHAVTSIRAALGSAREALIRRTHRVVHPGAAGLVAAFLFGDTSRLHPEVMDLFTRTGTRHLLALSGFHVGIVTLLIILPLARTLTWGLSLLYGLTGARRRRFPSWPLAAILCAAYAPLAGGGAPAARAAIAVALAQGARGIDGASGVGRRPHALNLLGVALLVELLLDPLAPSRPGVQLSYIATGALIVGVGPLGSRILGGLDARLAPSTTTRTGHRRSPWIRIAVARCLAATSSALAASAIATAATLPVVWEQFGEWSPAGMIATPLAVPALTVLVVGGWLQLALPALVDGDWLALASQGLSAMLGAFDRLPGTPFSLPVRPTWVLCAAGLAVVSWAAAPAGDEPPRERFGQARLRIAALLFAGCLAPLAGDTTALEVHLLDVGSGTSVILRAPRTQTWLIDAGSRDRTGVGRGAVSSVLRSVDVGSIQVVATHDDIDHVRDLPWISERWRVRSWVGPGAPGGGNTPAVGATPLTPPDAPLGIRALRGSDTPGNEGSLTLDVRWAGEHPARLVLFGDAEGPGLAALMSPGPGTGSQLLDPGPVDVLLLPHHGSASKHLARLLDHSQPREAWISSGTPAPGAREVQALGLRLHATHCAGPLRWSPGP